MQTIDSVRAALREVMDPELNRSIVDLNMVHDIHIQGDMVRFTLALTTMVFLQFIQAWNSRAERQSVFSMNPLGNPVLFYATIGAFALHLAAVYVPAFQFVLRTEPLSGADWLQVALLSVSVLVAVEVDKAIRRRAQARREAHTAA